jgi:hypothetical protein
MNRYTERKIENLLRRIIKEEEINLSADVELLKTHSSIPGCDPARLDFQRCSTEAFKTLPAPEFVKLFEKLSQQSDEPLENPMEKIGDMNESRRYRSRYRY